MSCSQKDTSSIYDAVCLSFKEADNSKKMLEDEYGIEFVILSKGWFYIVTPFKEVV